MYFDADPKEMTQISSAHELYWLMKIAPTFVKAIE